MKIRRSKTGQNLLLLLFILVEYFSCYLWIKFTICEKKSLSLFIELEEEEEERKQ